MGHLHKKRQVSNCQKKQPNFPLTGLNRYAGRDRRGKLGKIGKRLLKNGGLRKRRRIHHVVWRTTVWRVIQTAWKIHRLHGNVLRLKYWSLTLKFSKKIPHYLTSAVSGTVPRETRSQRTTFRTFYLQHSFYKWQFSLNNSLQ